MSAPCTNCPPDRIQPRTASIHGKYAIREGWGHKYEHDPLPRMGMSETKRDYLKSDAHKDSYAAAESSVCLAHAAGAPGECFGGLVPHHVLSRGQAGGQEAAERGWPVVTVCAGFNADVESKPAVRRWAESHTFVWNMDQNIYPFRINAAMARRINEDRVNRNPVRI